MSNWKGCLPLAAERADLIPYQATRIVANDRKRFWPIASKKPRFWVSKELIAWKMNWRIIGLHGRQLLRRRASFSAHSRHAEVLKRIGDRAGHLRHVCGEAGLALDIGIDGVGGCLALLFGEDGLLFEKRREELV